MLDELSLAEEIKTYLKNNPKGYTRSMYYKLKIKPRTGLSLNKFRDYLWKLVQQNIIDYKFKKDDYSYWVLKECRLINNG